MATIQQPCPPAQANELSDNHLFLPTSSSPGCRTPEISINEGEVTSASLPCSSNLLAIPLSCRSYEQDLTSHDQQYSDYNQLQCLQYCDNLLQNMFGRDWMRKVGRQNYIMHKNAFTMSIVIVPFLSAKVARHTMYNPDNNNINKEKVKEIKSLLMNFIIMS
jgi:hypothetical protein